MTQKGFSQVLLITSVLILSLGVLVGVNYINKNTNLLGKTKDLTTMTNKEAKKNLVEFEQTNSENKHLIDRISIPVNQKYGLLKSQDVIRDQKHYLFEVEDHTSTEEEKEVILSDIKESLSELFTTVPNESDDYFNKHFVVKSINWGPKWEQDSSTENKKLIIEIFVTYEFKDRGLRTNSYLAPNGNSVEIYLTFDFFDYKQGKFIKRSFIKPNNIETFAAYKKGFVNFISREEGENLIKNKFPSTNIDFNLYVSDKDGIMQVILEASNVTSVCKNKEDKFQQVSTKQCQVELTTKDIKCQDKNIACAAEI